PDRVGIHLASLAQPLVNSVEESDDALTLSGEPDHSLIEIPDALAKSNLVAGAEDPDAFIQAVDPGGCVASTHELLRFPMTVRWIICRDKPSASKRRSNRLLAKLP